MSEKGNISIWNPPDDEPYVDAYGEFNKDWQHALLLDVLMKAGTDEPIPLVGGVFKLTSQYNRMDQGIFVPTNDLQRNKYLRGIREKINKLEEYANKLDQETIMPGADPSPEYIAVRSQISALEKLHAAAVITLREYNPRNVMMQVDGSPLWERITASSLFLDPLGKVADGTITVSQCSQHIFRAAEYIADCDRNIRDDYQPDPANPIDWERNRRGAMVFEHNLWIVTLYRRGMEYIKIAYGENNDKNPKFLAATKELRDLADDCYLIGTDDDSRQYLNGDFPDFNTLAATKEGERQKLIDFIQGYLFSIVI